MKALSGYAEWFWLMAMNIKNVENRQWSLTRFFDKEDLPVRIYLHASKTKTPKCEMEIIEEMLTAVQLLSFKLVDFNKLRGNIIGEITITGQVEGSNLDFPELEWYWGRYGFLVKDGELYEKFIPYKGKLQFFEVNLAEAVQR
jgi:hypothetical protein